MNQFIYIVVLYQFRNHHTKFICNDNNKLILKKYKYMTMRAGITDLYMIYTL